MSGSATTSISDGDVRRALDAVHASSFVDRLPQGLDSVVAERGSTLSVGQKQLLSFARALAFDPRVLVLDEATSSVDTDTELLIRDALKVVMRGRTTIAIAHRLSTIQDMDRILVMHRGELREAGTHQELLALRGIYHRLYRAAVRIDDGVAPGPVLWSRLATAGLKGKTRLTVDSKRGWTRFRGRLGQGSRCVIGGATSAGDSPSGAMPAGGGGSGGGMRRAASRRLNTRSIKPGELAVGSHPRRSTVTWTSLRPNFNASWQLHM